MRGKPVSPATRQVREAEFRRQSGRRGGMFRRQPLLPCDIPRGGVGVSDSSMVAVNDHADWLVGRTDIWMRTYVRQVALADFCAEVVAVVAAIEVRFGTHPNDRYLFLSLAMPLLWMIAVRVFGGYE